MTTPRPHPLALALAGLASLTVPGARPATAADFRLDMSLGAASARLSQPAADFGRYHGITRDRNWLIADLNLTYKPDQHYVEASANNLALDNREAMLKVGRFGLYGINVDYGESPHPIAVDAATPFDGIGTNRLTLPNGFAKGANTRSMTNLAGNLKTADLRLDRTTGQARLFFTPTDRWRFEITAEQYSVRGKKPLGGLIYAGSVAALPAPVDERTSTLGAALNYRGETSQWSAGYKLSKYDNNYHSLGWDNPYAVPTPASAAPQGQLSLAPDNLQHTLGLTGAVSLPLASRLTLNVEKSRMEQDQALLPYSVNPASAITTPLPRESAKAQVDVTHVDLNLASRPLANLKTNLRYRYMERERNVPEALFLRVLNDTGAQIPATSGLAHRNFNDRSVSQQLKFDGSYSLARIGTLKAGVRHELADRSDRAVTKTTEDAVFGAFSRRFGDRADLEIRADHAKRKATDGYDQFRVFQQVHSPDYLNTFSAATLALRFDNHPLAQQYDIANRKRDNLGLSVAAHPTANFNVGLHAQHTRDAYPEAQLGLRSFASTSYTLDTDYSLPENYALFGYVTRENADYKIDGRQFGTFPQTAVNLAANYLDPGYDWWLANDDRILTVGLGGTKRALDDKLLMKLRVTRSYSDTTTRFSAASKLTAAADMPATQRTRDRLEFRADYEFRARATLGVGAIHDRLRIADWARDGIAAGSSAMADVLNLLPPNHGYHANTVYGVLGYRW